MKLIIVKKCGKEIQIEFKPDYRMQIYGEKTEPCVTILVSQEYISVARFMNVEDFYFKD